MATQKGRNWSSGDIVTAANLQSIERGVSEVAEEYTPTTWANGNTVTAAALNKIEQGIANAGGSSDFSTATVTTANGVYANFNSSIADAPMSPSFKYIGRTNNGGVDGDYLIALYQGNAILQADPGQTYSIDGGIESLGSGTFKVTGDCTITISDSSGGQTAA